MISMFRRTKDNNNNINQILSRLDIIESQLNTILKLLLNGNGSRSAVLFLITSKGESSMPLTVHVNDKPGVAKYQEFDGPGGTGNKVPPTGVVAYVSSDPTVATVDPSTGQLAYLTAGSTTISASDGGNLPASDVLTVTAAAAISSTMTLTPGA